MGTATDTHARARPPLQKLWRATSLALLLAAAITLAMAADSQRASAQSVDELSSKAQEARDRAEALSGQIEAQAGALAAKRQQAAAAATRESALSATLAAGQERAAELATAVDRARQQLRETRAELRRSVATLADRMVAMYKEGGLDAMELLLRSDGFDDLATRAEYMERIRAADAALIERTRDLRAQVAEQLAAVAAAREQQEAHNAEVASARDQIAAVRSQAEARAAALASAQSSSEAALGQLRSEIDQWEQRVQQAQRVSAAEAETQVAEQVETEGWAIPQGIVNCESGGDYGALNPSSGAGGAYQILPSTWNLYGGKGLPHKASPADQTRVAAQIWADSGSSAWECAG